MVYNSANQIEDIPMTIFERVAGVAPTCLIGPCLPLTYIIFFYLIGSSVASPDQNK